MDTSDVAALLTEWTRGRDARLLAHKFAMMRAGPFPFLRGSCPLFYRAWAPSPILDAAPLAWISGDLHVENFGSFKGDNRLTYFDLNDFDEAALAAATWDIARLLTSILVGGRAIGLNARDADQLARTSLDAYAAAVRLAKPRWIERQTARGMVRKLLAQTGRRSRLELLTRYTRRTGRHRALVRDNQRIWPIAREDSRYVKEIVAGLAEGSPDPGFFRVIDIARRAAGNGSLGVRRYVALVEGNGSPNRNALIDIKQELPSSVAPYLSVAQPAWASEAARVCAVQRRAQAVSPALLHSVEHAGVSFIVRELQPVADRVDLQLWARKPRKLQGAVEVFARLAAWAHVRTAGWRGASSVDAWLEFGARDDWQKPLLHRAREAAAQNARDYAAFSAFFDDGAFGQK